MDQKFKDTLKAAEAGDAEAQCAIGEKYYFGEGVEKDHKEAIKWFRKAVGQNYADAQYSLGVMYDNGEGVEKNHKEAVNWFRKAAEQGYEEAKTALKELSP